MIVSHPDILATSSRPHCILLMSSLHPHDVLTASSWLLSSSYCHDPLPSWHPCDTFVSPLHPHGILIASSWLLSYVCPPHCVLIVSSLHPPCILIASLLHPPFILLTSSFCPSHICMSSTYSFYNPLVSVSSFHYILTFLIHVQMLTSFQKKNASWCPSLMGLFLERTFLPCS